MYLGQQQGSWALGSGAVLQAAVAGDLSAAAEGKQLGGPLGLLREPLGLFGFPL